MELQEYTQEELRQFSNQEAAKAVLLSAIEFGFAIGVGLSMLQKNKLDWEGCLCGISFLGLIEDFLG